MASVISHLLLPSLVCLLVPLLLSTYAMDGKYPVTGG